MNKEKLLKLADFLDTVPRHKFDFSVFMKIGELPPAEAFENREGCCGTVGCAIGWSPLVFPDELKWDSRGNVIHKKTDAKDFEASMRIFGLSIQQADYLFMPIGSYIENGLDCHATPAQVAAHIREFVENDGEMIDKGKGYYE